MTTNDNKQIYKATKENPHIKGSRRAKTFDKIKNGVKVSAFLNFGTRSDLNFMLDRGYVKLKGKSARN